MSKKSDQIFEYSLGEDITNSIIHGIGAALSIAALVILLVFTSGQNDIWRVVSFSIYGGSLILLYLASTLYHSFRIPRVKNIFRIFDHASIYILIAGTYTPLTLVSIRGAWGWSIFGIIWGLAIIGIVFKSLFIDRYAILSVCIYILMGWLCVIAYKPFMQTIHPSGLIWLAIGGACYTFGIIFFAWDKLPYNHAIWHIFVLAGSICHFFSILFYVLPIQ